MMRRETKRFWSHRDSGVRRSDELECQMGSSLVVLFVYTSINKDSLSMCTPMVQVWCKAASDLIAFLPDSSWFLICTILVCFYRVARLIFTALPSETFPASQPPRPPHMSLHWRCNFQNWHVSPPRFNTQIDVDCWCEKRGSREVLLFRSDWKHFPSDSSRRPEIFKTSFASPRLISHLGIDSSKGGGFALQW